MSGNPNPCLTFFSYAHSLKKLKKIAAAAAASHLPPARRQIEESPK